MKLSKTAKKILDATAKLRKALKEQIKIPSNFLRKEIR